MYLMSNDREFEKSIYQEATVSYSPAKEKYLSLSLQSVRGISNRYGKSIREVEISALHQEIVPERYQRNMGTVGSHGQAKLLTSSVAVIGLGGLGGIVTELLARMGIGRIILVDGDTYSENNLNRQLMAVESNLEEKKALETAKRISQINSAVELQTHASFVGREELSNILRGVEVAIDCLDNLQTRFALEDICQQENIPLVYGAIAGYVGQIAVIWPGYPLLASIYGDKDNYSENGDRGVEIYWGNPATTPALVGTWEVNEAIKCLLEPESIQTNEMLHIDLSANEVNRIKIK